MDVGTLINGASGVLLVAMGLFVWSVAPERRVNRAFAVFGVGYGLRFVGVNAANLFEGRPGPETALVVLSIAGACVAAAALVALAAWFPRALDARERRSLVLPAVVALALLGTIIVGIATNFDVVRALPFIARRSPGAVTIAAYEFFSFQAAIVGIWFFLAVLALRFRFDALAADRSEARAYVFLSIAFCIYPAFVFGGSFEGNAPPLFRPIGLLYLAAFALLAFLWTRNIRHARPEDRGLVRAVPFALLLGFPVGYLTALWLGGGGAANDVGLPGLSRMLGEIVLAYAVLRHQLLGIDLKLRWGISKTTVAAIFIAVFFVVSEAAQQFFGERVGSQYLGILAAGALVFAIAPLSRVADRLAAKAVPLADASAPGPAAASRKEDKYRAAVRLALRDRVLTRDEERALVGLAQELGIDATRAYAIHDEVERDGSRSAKARRRREGT